MVVLCNLDHGELAAIRAILQALGKAFGLCTNFAKCSATPIWCTDELAAPIADELHCPVAQFLVQYLGLPLIQKPTSSSLLPIVYKLE